MLNTNCQIVDAERNDVSAQYPDVLKAIMANFTRWHESIMHSIDVESKCNAQVPDFKTRSFYDEGERLNITRMHRTDFAKQLTNYALACSLLCSMPGRIGARMPVEFVRYTATG